MCIYIFIYADNRPTMIHSSICLQSLFLKVKVTSAAGFINNLLNISLKHICGSIL